MNRTILYYPTIDVPRKDWLRHALLYWDQVSSIVPDDRKIRNRLSGHIDYLIGEGEFRPIKPEDLFHSSHNWEVMEQFTEEFKETVDAPEFQQFISRRNRVMRPSQIHFNKLGGNTTARIHNNKTTHGIFDFLKDRGLAARVKDDYDWLEMENYTGLLYMSLLAKYLADIDENHTTIGTDFVSYERFNFKKVNGSQGFPVISFNLNSVLPTPNPNVTIEQIVEFKRLREPNLLHFKKLLSDFQVKISRSKSQGELNEAAITFKENLVTGVTDLCEVLKDSKIEYRLKTLKSMMNLKSPTALATIGAAVNSNYHLVKLPFQFTALGVLAVGAIELATNYIENRNKQRVKLRESPFSYIYQAQRHGLINSF